MNRIQDLQGGETAHVPTIQVEMETGRVHGVKTMIGKRLDSEPVVPKRQVILIREPGDGGIDAVVTFHVVSFCGEDGKRALLDVVLDDAAQVSLIDIGRAPFEPDLEADENEAGIVDAVLASHGVLAGLADLGICPEWEEDGGGVKTTADGFTLTVEGAGKIINGLLKIPVLRGEGIPVRVVDAEEGGGNTLTIADLGEGMGVIPKGKTTLIDLTGTSADNRDDRPFLPFLRRKAKIGSGGHRITLFLHRRERGCSS